MDPPQKPRRGKRQSSDERQEECDATYLYSPTSQGLSHQETFHEPSTSLARLGSCPLPMSDGISGLNQPAHRAASSSYNSGEFPLQGSLISLAPSQQQQLLSILLSGSQVPQSLSHTQQTTNERGSSMSAYDDLSSTSQPRKIPKRQQEVLKRSQLKGSVHRPQDQVERAKSPFTLWQQIAATEHSTRETAQLTGMGENMSTTSPVVEGYQEHLHFHHGSGVRGYQAAAPATQRQQVHPRESFVPQHAPQKTALPLSRRQQEVSDAVVSKAGRQVAVPSTKTSLVRGFTRQATCSASQPVTAHSGLHDDRTRERVRTHKLPSNLWSPLSSQQLAAYFAQMQAAPHAGNAQLAHRNSPTIPNRGNRALALTGICHSSSTFASRRSNADMSITPELRLTTPSTTTQATAITQCAFPRSPSLSLAPERNAKQSVVCATCPVCKGPGRQSQTQLCTRCYSGVYKDIRKWLACYTEGGLELALGTSATPSALLDKFRSDLLGTVPRGCIHGGGCTSEAYHYAQNPNKRCTRCRTLAVSRECSDIVLNLLAIPLKKLGISVASLEACASDETRT